MSSVDKTSKALLKSMWLHWFASMKNQARKLTREVQQGITIGKAVVLAGWGNIVPKSRPAGGVDSTGVYNWKKDA